MYAEYKLMELQLQLEDYEKLLFDLQKENEKLKTQLQQSYKSSQISCVTTASSSFIDAEDWIKLRYYRRKKLGSKHRKWLLTEL